MRQTVAVPLVSSSRRQLGPDLVLAWYERDLVRVG